MVMRTISTVCCRLTARASSRGAVPNTSPATDGRPRPGCFTQSTKAAMPAWATSPIQDLFSADMARNQASRWSMDAMASVPSDPIARSSRWIVSSRTWPRGSGALVSPALSTAVTPASLHSPPGLVLG